MTAKKDDDFLEQSDDDLDMPDEEKDFDPDFPQYNKPSEDFSNPEDHLDEAEPTEKESNDADDTPKRLLPRHAARGPSPTKTNVRSPVRKLVAKPLKKTPPKIQLKVQPKKMPVKMERTMTTKPTHKSTEPKHLEHSVQPEHYTSPSEQLPLWQYVALALATLLIIVNQVQIMQVSAIISPSASPRVHTGAVNTSFSGPDGEYVTLSPALLAAGEQAVLPGYKTKIKQFPTISANKKVEPTGDAVQDAINQLIPTGTPIYGKEIGVSFDDPVNSLKILANLERTIKLTPEQQQRWKKITGSYTCDFCCGSPQNPTIITNCGCAHSAAWRGVAAHLIANHGDKYSDEQILGEMSRWKAIFYPGPIVQRVLQEQATSSGSTAAIDANALPKMVGGC